MLNTAGLYEDFVKYNFPNLITKSNIGQVIETLSSEDPDQTITVKSAYVNAQKESANGLSINFFKDFKPVIDFKNCLYYAFGGNLSQQKLSNFSDGEQFCESLTTTGIGTGQNIFFNNDDHVQTYLNLFKSGMI